MAERNERHDMHEVQEKYIQFDLNGEDYCLPILKTQEVIAEYHLTHLPNLPEAFRGVLSLRGEPVPVLDLRRKFGFPGKPKQSSTRVIIIDTVAEPIGIEVDRVKRVISFFQDEVERAPQLQGEADTAYISGVHEPGDGKFSIILDMDALLAMADDINLQFVRESIAAHYSVAPEALTGVEATVEHEEVEI